MSTRRKSTICGIFLSTIFLPSALYADNNFHCHPQTNTLAEDSIARQLGWVVDDCHQCGGYYYEEPFIAPDDTTPAKAVKITGNEGLLSQKGTSILEGRVTVTRHGQQMTANKAYLYRDPTTGKLTVAEMIGNVHLREPNALVISKKGRYVFQNQSKSLMHIIYRIALSARDPVPEIELKQGRRVTALSAWGRAYEFSQTEPKVYVLSGASFSTCPPVDPAWRIKASKIVLDKNTGRGYATNARLLVRNVPILYTPYFNFSIDRQRKSGFLWPRAGIKNQWGPYLLTPFYWNLAPNYDMTLMPGLLSKRGVQLSDNFRYLTHTSAGSLNVSVLPNDQEFIRFQRASATDPQYTKSTDPVVQAELNRLINASPTRVGLFWRNESRFNQNWSSFVDFNYAGDDYYLRNFGSSLKEISQNQLLQEADLFYKSEHWQFTTRLQAYQTLHPINEEPVLNQYRRFPQLILNADYPNQWLGLDYFINNELTHFEFLKTPGTSTVSPIGNRLHIQPGVSWPYYLPYFYINPRLQLALTQYNLRETNQTFPDSKQRKLPIFDIASGFSFYRDLEFFNYSFTQSLEPEVYYTYIPYRNQVSIPVFDTTVNTLVYDQIFNYNRFSGIDRIGDANQLGMGFTTRLIDHRSGLEKVRFGIGEIIYFKERKVTLCNDDSCSDNPNNPSNHWRLSPLSTMLNYSVATDWRAAANVLWNPISKRLNNTTLGLHYQTDNLHIFNIGYTYAYRGDVLSGITTNDSRDNLSVTDLSFSWPAPFMRDMNMLGLWSQNWNRSRLQNLFYGIQYDTCCWAVRMVAGRAFLGIDPNTNNYKYSNDFYIQFSLKGVGNIGDNPPRLGTISGYNPTFGQEL